MKVFDLSKDIRSQRIHTIGLCLGFILGIWMPQVSILTNVILTAICILIITVRYHAQKAWPDREPDKE